MKSEKIGIIGVNGKYGQWLKTFFENLDYTVIGSDIGTEMTNRKVVEEADVVIFSVPIEKVTEIVGSLVEFSRPKQLFMDITSIKAIPIQAMLKSQAEVIGLHPMCAPTVGPTWKGQSVVICPVRCSEWLGWAMDFLGASEAEIKITSPEAHDEQMAVIQALTHATNLIMAWVIRDLGRDVSEMFEYASPVYKLIWASVTRILDQSPEMYAQIQIANSEVTLPVLASVVRCATNFKHIVETKDVDRFCAEFRASGEHFGEDNLAHGYNLCSRLISLMADLSHINSFALQTREDRPGILMELAVILKEYEINIESYHTFKEGDFYLFTVGIDKPIISRNAQAAIKEICKVKALQFVPFTTM